jgi:hypothetical protein
MASGPVKTVTLEIPAPEFLNFLESNAREQIIAEVQNQVLAEITRLFEYTAQKLVSEKFNLATPKEPLKKGVY